MTVVVAPIPWLQSDRPSTAATADAADLNVPAKEAAKLLLSSLTRFPGRGIGSQPISIDSTIF